MRRERSALTGLLAAFLSVAAITILIYGLREFVPVVSTGLVYMLAVLLVSSYWGLTLGLLTALLSAAAFNFFHIRRPGSSPSPMASTGSRWACSSSPPSP